MNSKISIRFYKDREVRAVWDDEQNKWWFSVLDIISVVNGCRMEEVIWNTSVMIPICANEKSNLSFTTLFHAIYG